MDLEPALTAAKSDNSLGWGRVGWGKDWRFRKKLRVGGREKGQRRNHRKPHPTPTFSQHLLWDHREGRLSS